MEMGSVTRSSGKNGQRYPYANKKWVARSDNKTVFNNRGIGTVIFLIYIDDLAKLLERSDCLPMV